MNIRWITATLIALTQITSAQDSLNWNIFAFPLSPGDQQGLETLMTDTALWQTIAEDTEHPDIKRLNVERFRQHLPIADEKTYPMMSEGTADRGKYHDYQFVQHVPLHAMEYIPETDPKRYLLKEIDPEPLYTMRLKWDNLSPENNLDFNIQLTHSPITGRESVEGTTLDVGKPKRKQHSVTFEGTAQMNTMSTYLWKPADSLPVIIRFSASGTDARYMDDTVLQYAMESKAIVIHGPIKEIVSDMTLTPSGFTLVNGKAHAFRNDKDPGNNAGRILETGSESLEEKVLLIAQEFGVKVTDHNYGLASAPRVTDFITDTKTDRYNTVSTLFKIIVSNAVSKSSQEDSSRRRGSNTFNFTDLQQLAGKYHTPFSGTPSGREEMMERKYSIIADFSTQSVRVGRQKDAAFKTVEQGIMFSSAVATTDQEDLYDIDFFHLNRQHEKLPKSIKNTPEALAALEAGFRDSHFRYKYNAKDGETVGFFYSATPTEHYIILNTMTVVDPGGTRYN